MFSGLKEVTIADYLNNLFNHSLIKKNERYAGLTRFDCELCSKSGLADRVYKIHSLPNNLLITMIYKDQADRKYLRLKNFMEIDMQPFIHQKFYNFKMNPFHLEKQDQFKYKLCSLIIYSSNNPTREGYITYVRHRDNTWIRFSKYPSLTRYSIAYINQSEVEEIKHPYLLIYNREFEGGNERSNIRSHLEILNITTYKSEMR